EITDDVGRERDAAADQVLPADLAVAVRDTEANGRGLPAFDAPARLLARDVPAPADVLGGLHVPQRLVAVHLELLLGAEAVVRQRLRHQLGGVRAIDVQPLGLPIRAVRAA